MERSILNIGITFLCGVISSPLRKENDPETSIFFVNLDMTVSIEKKGLIQMYRSLLYMGLYLVHLEKKMIQKPPCFL